MSIPVWVLLGFAGWTLVLMMTTIGIYRWSRILSGQSEVRDFGEYRIEGKNWYERAMRAHANCVENLPVYGAIVIAIVAGDVRAQILDVLAIVFLAARVVHSLIHVTFEHSNLTTSVRFTFFFIQLICMIWMGTYVVFHFI